MAVQSIAVPPDPARDARALALVDQVPTWPRHTLKVAWGAFEAGTTFRRAYGSNGARYLVNAVACECPDYQQGGYICKHVRAVVLFEQRQQPARRSGPRTPISSPPVPPGAASWSSARARPATAAPASRSIAPRWPASASWSLTPDRRAAGRGGAPRPAVRRGHGADAHDSAQES